MSPLLGVTLDYSQIVPRGDADASSARAAYARAVAWLGVAPFVLAARGEVEGAELSVAAARAHTRAALLIARLVEFDVDVEAAYAWHQWNALAELAGGASDDVLAARAPRRGALGRGWTLARRRARSSTSRSSIDCGTRSLDGRTARARRRRGHRRGAAPRAAARRADFTRAATSVRILPPRGASRRRGAPVARVPQRR